MEMSLRGRVALITGATGGIGTAISTELYNLGAGLVLTGRDQDKLYRLRDQITQKAPTPNKVSPVCIAIDLTAIDARKVLISRTIESFGRLDILINNAGLIDGRMFLKSDKEFVERMMHVNFTAPYFLTQEALPHMLKNRFGRIINITSIAGYIGDAGMSAYAASKGALASATKSIAVEYGRRGITANCIAPGAVEGEASTKITPEHIKKLKEDIPLRRLAKAKEVANTVAFLASEGAAYINGQQIHVNGGLIR